MNPFHRKQPVSPLPEDPSPAVTPELKLQAILELMDSDDNGVLSKPELHAHLVLTGYPYQNVVDKADGRLAHKRNAQYEFPMLEYRPGYPAKTQTWKLLGNEPEKRYEPKPPWIRIVDQTVFDVVDLQEELCKRSEFKSLDIKHQIETAFPGGVKKLRLSDVCPDSKLHSCYAPNPYTLIVQPRGPTL
jgi:hypothetical protein